MKRPITLLLIAAFTATLLAGCSTLGNAVDSTGKMISKGGRAVKTM